MCYLLFFRVEFSKKPKNFEIFWKIEKKVKIPKIADISVSGPRKKVDNTFRTKFFTDHESALRLFKNKSKL